MLTFEQARNLYFRFKTTNAVGKNKGFKQLQKLHDYYVGQHEIVNKKQRPNDKKTYRVVNNYPQYTATISTGYFMGVPVSYISTDKDTLEPALDIIEDNDGETVDYDNALDVSIYGRSYRVFYHDERGELNFKDIDPRNTITIGDGAIKEKLTDAIYFSDHLTKDNEIEVKMSLYDETEVKEYKFTYKADYLTGDNTKLIEMIMPSASAESVAHNITDELGNPKLPIIKFENNKFELGDYEPHLSLIDAYNDMQSTNMEDATDFTDAILKLVNLYETDDRDLKAMKDEKVMMLGEDGDAEWLIKQINDTFVNNMKERLEADIHKYTFVPNMNDKNFGGNLTGVAIKYKLLALEQVRGQKERSFNKALTDQLAIIKGYLDKFTSNGKSFELKDVKLQFTPNLPPNYLEEADLVTKLRAAGLPDKFIFSFLSKVQDVDHLIEMKKEEEEEKMGNDYQGAFGGKDNQGKGQEEGDIPRPEERVLDDNSGKREKVNADN